MLLNSFGGKGVHEFAYFLKEISDAQKINRLLNNFELSLENGIDQTEKRRLLHTAIVGGCPTGVEFGAELYDVVQQLSERQGQEFTLNVSSGTKLRDPQPIKFQSIDKLAYMELIPNGADEAEWNPPAEAEEDFEEQIPGENQNLLFGPDDDDGGLFPDQEDVADRLRDDRSFDVTLLDVLKNLWKRVMLAVVGVYLGVKLYENFEAFWKKTSDKLTSDKWGLLYYSFLQLCSSCC